MKTFIDPELCISCGLCIDTCPDLYEMGDEVAVVIVDSVPADLESCSIEAEEACPTEAIYHED